jgi:hypothetical protein
MSSHSVDRGRFVEVMSREGVPESVSLRVLRAAAIHVRLAVIACNRGMTRAEERKDERTEERIVEMLKPYGIEPQFQGDPRGCTVKLKLPSGRSNDWGGERVYCVPQPYC